MDGLQDVIFVKMYALNKSVPYNDSFETTPKEWVKNLSIESLNWSTKPGEAPRYYIKKN